MINKDKNTDGKTQLLHLVFGGELKGLHDEVEFCDTTNLDVIGIFPNYATAYNAWKEVSQASVDNAQMRYFIVHMHRLLNPEHAEMHDRNMIQDN